MILKVFYHSHIQPNISWLLSRKNSFKPYVYQPKKHVGLW